MSSDPSPTSSPPAAPAAPPGDEPKPPPALPLRMPRRAMVLAHALRGRTTGGGLGGLVRHVAGPTCVATASRHIERVEEVDGMRAVYLAGHADPLFYPAGADMHMLYQVLAEQLAPWAWHRYEVPETTVRPGDVVLDCGAAEGLFAFLVRDRAERVFAIEPLAEFRACMERTFAHDPRVEVVPLALGAAEGTAYIRAGGISSGVHDDGDGEPVRVVTIDDFCRERGVRPTYLKADLEAYELRVLHGARETIRAHKPRIAITTYHRPDHAERIAALLRELRPDYQMRVKGIEDWWGAPLMLHAW